MHYQNNPSVPAVMPTHYGSHAIESMTVTKLVMSATGRHQPMYYRPFVAHASQEMFDDVINRAHHANATLLNSNMLANISGSLLSPSANAVGVAKDSAWWDEPRYRFMMEVEVITSLGSVSLIYLQGHTDYLGVSQSGHIDPRMNYTINSIIETNRVTHSTPYGVQSRDLMTNNYQLLQDTNPENNWANVGTRPSVSLQSQRPIDLYHGLNAGLLGYSEANSIDTRTFISLAPLESSRSNANPGEYLSRSINAYVQAAQNVDYAGSFDSIVNQAIGLTLEPEISRNMFIRAIRNIEPSVALNVFSHSALRVLSPNVDQIAQVNNRVVREHQPQAFSTPEHGEYWHGADFETNLAVKLVQIVTTLMSKYFLSKVEFSSGNLGLLGAPITIFHKVLSFTSMDDIATFVEFFKQEFEYTVLIDLTMNNQVLLELDVFIDMYGTSKVAVGLNGQSKVWYVAPSYCDSMWSPMISPSSAYAEALTSDIGNLAELFAQNIRR